MNVTRWKIAFLLGAGFLAGNAIAPDSARYLATVGWVLILVVTPLFWVLERLASRSYK